MAGAPSALCSLLSAAGRFALQYAPHLPNDRIIPLIVLQRVRSEYRFAASTADGSRNNGAAMASQNHRAAEAADSARSLLSSAIQMKMMGDGLSIPLDCTVNDASLISIAS